MGLCVPDGCEAKGFSLLYGLSAGGFGLGASVSTSCREQVQVALASLIAMLQVALASLIDSVVLDLLWQRAMLSSQTNFCQQASMDDLVASRSPRALLASLQRRAASLEGVPLQGPGVLAMGKGTVGISSREASPISASSGVPTWDDVSTGLERSPSLWGRGVSRTIGFSLFGVEFVNPCPDMSNTVQVKSSLTSMVVLTSPSTFGRVALMELAIRMEGQTPEGSAFGSGTSTVDCRMPTFR